MIIHLIVGLIKKVFLYKNELFSIFAPSKNKIEVELDLSNYATKSDLKNATGFTKKADLANLKFDVDVLDNDKLKKCIKWFKQFEK